MLRLCVLLGLIGYLATFATGCGGGASVQAQPLAGTGGAGPYDRAPDAEDAIWWWWLEGYERHVDQYGTYLVYVYHGEAKHDPSVTRTLRTMIPLH